LLLIQGNFATSGRRPSIAHHQSQPAKKLVDLTAEVIITATKRMRQSVDALFDSNRYGGPSGRATPLKSLTDMIRETGRFREKPARQTRRLFGPLVIVVGPTLRLHQCRLPKKIALGCLAVHHSPAQEARSCRHDQELPKKMLERGGARCGYPRRGHPITANASTCTGWASGL
jgi:DNA-directed RNA polymerase beta' subunit